MQFVQTFQIPGGQPQSIGIGGRAVGAGVVEKLAFGVKSATGFVGAVMVDVFQTEDFSSPRWLGGRPSILRFADRSLASPYAGRDRTGPAHGVCDGKSLVGNQAQHAHVDSSGKGSWIGRLVISLGSDHGFDGVIAPAAVISEFNSIELSRALNSESKERNAEESRFGPDNTGFPGLLIHLLAVPSG